MDKILSPEEKIRRAEEIYYRRKNQEDNRNYARVNVSTNKRDYNMLKKMFLQILICAVIYTIFYMIKNTDYIFSEDVINKTKEILAYDMNITKLYNQLKDYLNSLGFLNTVVNEDEIKSQEENKDSIQENNQEIKQQDSIETVTEEIQNDASEAIGGEEVEEIKEETILTQMEQDAKDIIDTKSLIIPLKGTITSRFGPRNSENPIVSKNHTGIDIAVSQGTVFIASMSGIVEEVSSIGELGNHLKIISDNVETVYAHCKTIYVTEGEKIVQGQKLGEVGMTRKCNWTTLTF